jgi:DNA (cytosine-5)-methyltransferase 1
MKHGSLFSGIGGFDLAAEWMGWENVFHCEWMDFPRKVLNYYWPNADSHINICETDFKQYANKIDILTGGFPCQPYSSTGKRKGKEDPRHLWPEMLRCITEISPRFIVGENVRGLTNWNGGMVFNEVCAEMENFGYQVAPVIIPASAVNAPHQRERIWFVAYSNSISNRRKSELESDTYKQTRRGQANTKVWDERKQQFVCNPTNPNTYCNGQHKRNCEYEKQSDKRGEHAQHDIKQIDVNDSKNCGLEKHRLQIRELGRKRFTYSDKRNNWNAFPSQSPICSGNDGLSFKLDGITFPKWRAESLKGYGNAIVPNVAYEIFKVIEKLDKDFK